MHLDTLRVRSAVTIEAGQPDQETRLRFVDQVLGGDNERPPLEILIVVEGLSVIPDFSAEKTITLKGAVAAPLFIRADANSDRRVNIADGIWIINMLFYAGQMTACKPAADANADSLIDLSDALFIFNYRLQPGVSPGNLFPAPSAPFPDCGSAEGVTLEDCPQGSHVCF
jgi:hypothetical protein